MSKWISVKDRTPDPCDLMNIKWISKINRFTGLTYITHWSYINDPEILKEKLKLEVGKVYDDIKGRRILIYNNSSTFMVGNIFYGLYFEEYMSQSFSYYSDGKCQYNTLNESNLIKLSDNQFPGVI